MPNFLLIDGSYYCFYRYFAIEQWFKLAKRDEKIENPFEHELFVEKFRIGNYQRECIFCTTIIEFST